MIKLFVFGNYNSPHINTWNVFYNINENLEIYKSIKLQNENFSMLSFLKDVHNVNKFIKNNNIDLVHTHSAGIYGLKSLFLCQKFVVTIYGSELYNSVKSPLKKFLMNIILKKAEAISCSSIAAKEFIEDNFSESINAKTYLFSIPAKPIFINKNSNSRINVFSNRRIGDLYNTFEIIKGYEQAKDKLKDDIGDLILLDGYSDNASYRNSIFKYIENSSFKDNIKVITNKISSEELNILYNNAKCFINIPDSDQLSLSFLEGIKTDCIPIVSNIPAYIKISEKYNIKRIQTINNKNLDLDIKNSIVEIFKTSNYEPDFLNLNNEYNNINESFKNFKKFIGDAK